MRPERSNPDVHDGGIVCAATDPKRIALVFTGQQFTKGGETVLRPSRGHGAIAAFFLAGEFYANAQLRSVRGQSEAGPRPELRARTGCLFLERGASTLGFRRERAHGLDEPGCEFSLFRVPPLVGGLLTEGELV